MAPNKDPLSDTESLQKEIMVLRERAEQLVDEISSRMRRRLDLGVQWREHGWTLVGVVIGGSLLAGGAWMVGARRNRRMQRFPVRMRRKLGALRTVLLQPEKVVPRERSPSLWVELLLMLGALRAR